ncbi:MAG: hypothetical protein ACOZQL_15050 [Myxococcota bacterium]
MFTAAERDRCRAIFEATGSDEERRVLADALLERGEPLGELIHLQCEGESGDELLRELRPRLKRELYPWAKHVALERGLPIAAALDPQKFLRADDATKDPVWPLRRVAISADSPGTIYGCLRAPLFDFVERLDLSDAQLWSPYTMFVDGTPAPCRALPRLSQLAVPRDFLPAHWVPVLGPAFAEVRTLLVPASGEALREWFPLLPRLETIELLVDRRGVSAEVQTAAVGFVEQDRARRTLKVNGMEVSLEHLRTALPTPGAPVEALARVATPPAGRATHVEVHALVVPEVPLVEATIDGERGLWLELPSRKTSFGGLVGQRQDVRLAMLAPRHRHVVAASKVVENEQHTWVRLEDDLAPFRRPVDPEQALRAARELASALAALHDFMRTSAADVAWPYPLTEGELLQRADGSLAVLLPRPHHFPSRRTQPSLGLPVALSERGLVLFVGWVLAQWCGVRLPRVVETNDTDVLFEQSVALDRFLEAPRCPGVDPRVAEVLERCWSPRQERRFASLAQLAQCE